MSDCDGGEAGVECKAKKAKVVPESTWRNSLLRRAKGIYQVLKAREKVKLAAFVKANKKTLAQLSAMSKVVQLANHAAHVEAAKFSDAKHAFLVAASASGVVSGKYVKRDKTEVSAPKKFLGYEFNPGRQVFNPAHQGDIVRFLGNSKHVEYQNLLDEYETLRMEIELAELPVALAALRAFRAAPAPRS